MLLSEKHEHGLSTLHSPVKSPSPARLLKDKALVIQPCPVPPAVLKSPTATEVNKEQHTQENTGKSGFYLIHTGMEWTEGDSLSTYQQNTQ